MSPSVAPIAQMSLPLKPQGLIVSLWDVHYSVIDQSLTDRGFGLEFMLPPWTTKRAILILFELNRLNPRVPISTLHIYMIRELEGWMAMTQQGLALKARGMGFGITMHTTRSQLIEEMVLTLTR